MGSPLTLSGFNGIDFSQILSAVMAAESRPLNDLSAQKTGLQTQGTLFGTLATKLGQLQTATSALSAQNSLQVVKATSSDESAVAIGSATGTVVGSYNVVVSGLAQAQVTASSSTYASTTAVVATAGTLTLQATAGAPVTITASASMTLQGLADAINNATGSPARASLVQSSPGQYLLVLTGATTGAANAFTITNGLTGGAGVTFIDTNANGVSGDSPADNAVSATDAALTVNNIAITSSTNSVTDAVPGVTLTLKKKDPLATVRVDVANNVDAAKTSVKAFVTAFNDLLSFFGDQQTAAAGGKANISRDPLLRGLQTSLRSTLSQQYVGGTYDYLAAIGLGFNASGRLTLDEKIFDAAIAANPSAVQTLFSSAAGNGGAFGAMDSLIKGYTQAGGLVADARSRITTQSDSLQGRIDNLQAQLDIRRASLQKEYIAADLAMTQLKSQSSSLSAIGGGYRLF